MPAAAVIPAPIAYIKVAAVKKLVVEKKDHFSSRPKFLIENRMSSVKLVNVRSVRAKS